MPLSLLKKEKIARIKPGRCVRMLANHSRTKSVRVPSRIRFPNASFFAYDFWPHLKAFHVDLTSFLFFGFSPATLPFWSPRIMPFPWHDLWFTSPFRLRRQRLYARAEYLNL